MLNQRIKINKYSAAQNQYGESVETLVTSSARWAEVKEKSGNVHFGSGAMDWDYDISVRFRYYASEKIENKDLIEWLGDEYRIVDSKRDDSGYKFFVILKCKKVE